jgi:small subunit ribosomal protein S20
LPKSKSAEKAARSSERKRLRNRSVRSATRSHITKTGKLISNNELEPAQKALSETISVLDKAAKKKVLHHNTASRYKSRLMKRFNKAKLSTDGKAETTKAGKKTGEKQSTK